MKKLLLGMFFCIIIAQIYIAQAKKDELINEQFFNSNTYVQNYDPYEDINEKYSYNEKEEINIMPKYLKPKYDINMGKKSKMSVGLKGISFKFKY